MCCEWYKQRSHSLHQKDVREACVPRGRGCKGEHILCWSECLHTLCCNAAQLQQCSQEGITGTSLHLCCLLRLVGNVNFTPARLRPAHRCRLVWPSLGCGRPHSLSLSLPLLCSSGWALWDITTLGRALPSPSPSAAILPALAPCCLTLWRNTSISRWI